jgi:type VI protein secretion system component Hcp
MDRTVRHALRRSLLVAVALTAGSVGYAVHGGSDTSSGHKTAAHATTAKLAVGDLLLAASTAATKDIHLNFAGVTTGAENPTHSNDIPIKSFSFGVERPTQLGPSGPTPSKAAVSDINVGAVTDSHTLPLLQSALTAANPGVTATLYFTNLSGTPFDYLQIALGDTLITSLQMSSSGSAPTVAISMTFLTMTFTYLTSGSATPQTVTYNVYAGS